MCFRGEHTLRKYVRGCDVIYLSSLDPVFHADLYIVDSELTKENLGNFFGKFRLIRFVLP